MKKFALNFLVLVVTIVLTLACMEVGLRIAHIGYPSLGGVRNFFTWDPYTGTVLRPGVAAMWHVENDNFVRINSQGHHDREHSPQKPPNAFRIAVLGDSFVEGLQIPTEKTFSSVLERQLKGCPAFAARNAESLNFGVSGYGTAQELQMLRHYVWNYSPDLVLLAFFTGNDVMNNKRELERDPYRPYFVHQNGKLILDDSFLNAPGFRSRFSPFHLFVSWAGAHSRLLQVFSAARNYAKTRDVGGNEASEAGLNDFVYHEPTEPIQQEAWSVTEDLITAMRDDVRARGVQFLVVTLSTGIQVDPDPAAREKLEKQLGVSDLYYSDNRVRDLANREGIPVLTLAPTLLQYAQEHHVVLHGFHGERTGHWNEAGHEAAGEFIAQKVCSMIQSPSSSEGAPAGRTTSSPR